VVICGLSDSYHFFCHHLRKGIVFGKKNVGHRIRVLTFSAPFLCKVPHSKKNSAKYHKCAHFLMLSTRYSRQILIQVGVFQQFFEKVSNVTKIRPVGAQLRTGGRTLWSNSRSFANAPENVVVFS
jgi:hypothetical protein